VPYFFILPAFALYVACCVVLIAASYFVEGLRHLRAPMASILAWSSAGFVVANLLYTVLGMAVLNLIGEAPTNEVVGIVGAVGLFFVLPIVFSSAGIIGGIILGLRRRRLGERAA